VKQSERPLPGLQPMLRAALAGLALVIVVVLVLIWQSADAMRRQINDDFNQQQLVLARQAAGAIEHRVGEVEAETASLVKLLAQTGSGGPAAAAAMEMVLDRCEGLGVEAVRLVDGDGRILLARGTPLLPGVPPVAEIGRISGGSARILAPPRPMELPDGTGRRMAGQVGAVARGETGLLAVVSDVDFTELLHREAGHIRSGRTGYLWAIDGEGRFLEHPDPQFVGRSAFEARHLRAPEIDFRPIDRIMRERMLQGQEGVGTYVSGWHGGLRGTIPKLIAYTPVRHVEVLGGGVWSVAVVAPESEVAATVHRVFRRHTAAVVVLFVALGLLAAALVSAQRRTSILLQRQVERTEAELHEVERIYRRVVQQASDLIYLLDLEAHLILANPPAVRFFARIAREPWRGNGDEPPAERYLGRPLTEILRPEDAEFVLERLDQALFCGHGISYEHSVRMEDAKRRLSTRLMPIREDTGGIRYVLGISRDISEKVAMDQRIYNAEKLASIGNLAAGVAHEINNPLAVILGFTDLLLERFPEGTPEHEDLQTIEHQANVAKQVVENLLGFARVTEGLEDTVYVRQSIETVVSIVRNTLMTNKIEVEVDVPDDLPRVRGDAREFQQVIFNLVNNALAAMESEGGVLSLQARRQGGEVEILVRDTGCGIPENVRPRIFDPFFTTKPVGKGTGLGLSLCYGIVTKYGGSISVASVSREESPEGPTGTTVTVRFPVAPPVPVGGGRVEHAAEPLDRR